jgi:hypothetical protein
VARWAGRAGCTGDPGSIGAVGLRGRTERVVAAWLGGLAVVTVLFGLWLLYVIASRG